ncbi:RagB/SusD family nutrient uptake outer membrane protein [Sphingobacterium sp. SRCM116780]|uniref:RagB/SusD family nutrient uptake outer membrane protein n=1 Tax=Sphingobacterium sp. SRCM116780 TaxID=2907623 RepID=UPI001F3E78BE|nr:RagB/SusD family nutrient uptake outer membrane protein [Sphingobacterium sp. SRCM116780]UIR57448.1 RagB/SusD family nutrient uptake outer membrane protein [Sphingobacterium sp. SRCM116780]
MKNILKNQMSLFLLGLLLLSSMEGCSSFLDVDSPSVVTDQFYDSKEGQEKLIVDLYVKSRAIFNTGEIQYFGTDLYMAITEGESERMFNGYDKTFNGTAPVIGGYWNNLYKIVQESNILLTRTSVEIAGNDYQKMVAKGKFFRALAYYYLVETFGDVPLYLEEQKEVLKTVQRVPEAQVYKQLIEDLESAKGILTFGNSEAGEINDAAIRFLLGKLYLTRAYKPYAVATDFKDAAQNFTTIKQSSQYRLLSSYASVYDENNQNNSEVIWAMQYGTDKNYVGSGNPQQQLFGFNITALEPDLFVRNQADYSAMSRQYWVIPKAHEYFEYPELDTRYDVTFKRSFTINNPTNKDFGKLGIYFPRWNDESGNTPGALRFYPFKTGTEYNWYPQSTALPILTNAIDRMPIIEKFKDTKMPWGGAGTREDVIFRLSDTYLLAAEAYLGMHQNQDALNLINDLRKRAAVSESAFNDHLKIMTISLDGLLDERARELMGEHDRWFDLKRTGKLLTRVKANNPLVQKYNNLNTIHLLRPIPQDEINKTEGLTQNNGYN